MLQSIRDKVSGWVAKVLLGALVIVFVFWGISLQDVTSSATSAAEVNGESISLTSLQNAWQQRQSELQQTLQSEIPEALKKQQQTLLLNQMINSTLVQQRASKLGFRVSDADIATVIRGLDSFKVDGQFSRDRYASYLLQQGMNEAQFEAQYRTELQVRELQNGIAGTAFVTASELQRQQALINEQREIDYVVLPVSAYRATVKVADADLATWYEANKASYMTPETVDLQYVELKLADSASDVSVDDAALRAHYEQIKDRFTSEERRHGRHILIAVDDKVSDAAAKKQAEEVLAKLKAGGDFAALAKQYSKDPGSAAKGGDLGWATKGQFVKPFEEALFSLKVGETTSAPVKSEFGYHLIRLEEVEGGAGKSFEEARAEVEADYKSERASSLFYDKTQKLADAAFAKLTELDSVAKEFNAPLKSVTGFTRQGGGEFGNNAQVIEAAFSDAVLNKNENSPLVTLGEDRALVLRVTAHQTPQQKPLADVRADVLAKVTDKMAQDAAKQQAMQLAQQLQSGAVQWSALNKTVPAVPVGKKLLGRSAEGVQSAILSSAFAVPRSSVTSDKPAYRSVALSGGDYALLSVTAVQPGAAASGAEAATALSSLRDQQVNQLASREFTAYLKQLELTADIERNPKAFD